MATKKHSKPIKGAKKLGNVKPLAIKRMAKVEALSNKTEVF